MDIGNKLQGRYVLIAHEDSFQRSYLRGVVQAAGAAVTHTVDAGGDGLALLRRGSGIHAVILSYALPHPDAIALLTAAMASDIKIVVVHPAQAEVTFPFSDHRCLAIPYGGFQVVDALADALTQRRGCIHWSARPSRVTGNPGLPAGGDGRPGDHRGSGEIAS